MWLRLRSSQAFRIPPLLFVAVMYAKVCKRNDALGSVKTLLIFCPVLPFTCQFNLGVENNNLCFSPKLMAWASAATQEVR